MYQYITRHRGLYALYAFLLVISSVMSVFFAFILSEIFDCAQEKNVERLIMILFGGILFLVISVVTGYCFGIVKNHLLCKARQELKQDLFERILHKSVLEFEFRNLGEYMNELQNNLNLYEDLYFKNILQIPAVILSFAVAVGVCLYISPTLLLLIMVIGVLISVMVKKSVIFWQKRQQTTQSVQQCIRAK